MRKIVFFLLLLFALYQRDSRAAESAPFSFDAQKRISSFRRKDGTLLFYSYDNLNRISHVSSSDASCEYEFIYEDTSLEPAIVYNKEGNIWPSPLPNELFSSEKPIPSYVRWQEEIGKLILKGAAQFTKVGWILEEISKKLPVPVVKDLFWLSSEILKLAYNPIEETPYVYLLKTLGEKDTPIRMGYLNGMMNVDENESLYSGQLIKQKTEEDIKLDLFYMPSHGFIIDLLECVLLKMDLQTPNTVIFRKEIRKILKELPPDSKYILLLHSKASLLSSIALKDLPQEEKDKLELYSFAPVSILNNSYGSIVKNLSSMFDAVPFQSPIGLVNYLFSKEVKFEWLSPLELIPLFDHRFSSETYQNKIKEVIKEVLSRYEPLTS